MSDYESLADKGRKLSRLEREREKIRVAQENINRILATEKEKQRKQDTRDKILLGVMLQGMIADGAISTEMFERALEKYLTNDKDRERCDAYYEQHSTWKPHDNVKSTGEHQSISRTKLVPKPDSIDL